MLKPSTIQLKNKKKYLKNYKPATGKVYSLIPDSGKEDVELAVQSAKKAFFL